MRLVYVIFAVETVFLYPWAVAFARVELGIVHRDDGVRAAVGRRAGVRVGKGRVGLEIAHGLSTKD